MRSLSRTEKSLVAIARALVVDCDFLVLDEPTASLPADEVERLFDAIRRLKSRGVGMIYVSHRLDEIFRIADRVIVMRDGSVVGEKPIGKTNPDELIGLIVGRSTFELFHKAENVAGPTRVAVRGLATPGAGPVDFDVREGEILGLVGLRGAGQEEIGRALFGAMPHAGSILIDGKRPELSSPRAAVQAGVGLVARDRAEEFVASSLSVRENAYLNPRASGRGLFSRLSPGAEARKAIALGASVGLRPNDPELPIESLSGGNQQKVVVGRWLTCVRSLLVAEDPTAGVDVGAKAEIYRLIEHALRRKARGRGGLDRLRGDRPSLPSRACLQSRQDHRRADRRRAHDRVGDRRGVGVGSGVRSRGGGSNGDELDPLRRAGAHARTNSKTFHAGRASLASCRSTACPFSRSS